MDKHTVYIDHTMLASGNKRFVNYIVDTIMYYMILGLLGVIAGALSLMGYDGMLLFFTEINPLLEFAFNLSIMGLYYVLMEALTQRTLGKFITGTRVVMADGSKPEAGIIVKRTLCRFIPFEQFSFIGSTPRGWHDSLSDTYLIDIKKYDAEMYRRTSIHEIGQEQEY